MDTEAANDVYIPELTGLPIDNPQVVQLYKKFAENPLEFGNGKENGMFIVYNLLSSIQNTASDLIARSRIPTNNLVMMLVTHQIPRAVLRYVFEKQTFDGLQMVEDLDGGNFWARIQYRKLKGSLEQFKQPFQHLHLMGTMTPVLGLVD
ncbi:MAG: hypothetical protein LBL30_00555 [Holosporales bacterium]|nr:hypothetical protein [Holosporales bacterium]